MPRAYPQWKGFERAPEGHLLDQVIDLSGPMGLAYERSVGFRKDFHVHDRPMILLPRGSCVVRVRTAAGDRTETHTIRSTVAFIVPNLFSDLSLAAIARNAFASPSTLLRHFRKDTGKSPHAYVKARRLEEARRLLETGTQAVGEVGLLVGYENFAAFTTAFTKHFGASPSSFRKRARASSS